MGAYPLQQDSPELDEMKRDWEALRRRRRRIVFRFDWGGQFVCEGQMSQILKGVLHEGSIACNF